MKRFLLVLFLFSSFFSMFAQEYTLETVKQNGKSMQIKRDKITNSPHRIFGLQDKADNLGINFEKKHSRLTKFDPTTDKNIKNFTKSILNTYYDKQKINSNDLEIERIDMLDGVAAVTLKQYYKGIPVKNSTIGFSTKPDGSIVSFGADLFPNIKVNHKPSITRETALQIAAEHFGVNYTERTCEELVIYPVKKEESFEYYLAWQFHLDSEKFSKSEIIYISAHSGELLQSFNQIASDGPISGTLKAQYYPQHYYDALSTYELKDIEFSYTTALGEYFGSGSTDQTGYFCTPSFPTSQRFYFTVGSNLENGFVKVQSQYSSVSIPGWSAYPGSNSDIIESASDAFNVFYHANHIHDYFVNNHSFHGVDYSMIARVNYQKVVNSETEDIEAHATGTEIRFGNKDGKKWARSSDVIYHEYTHNVVYNIYNGWIDYSANSTQGAALNEAFPDYFACTLNNDPLEGESVRNPRNLDNSYSALDTSLNNSHEWSQVISGACWDIRQQVGQPIADDLVFKALQISPQAKFFNDYLENLLIADSIFYNSTYKIIIENAFASRDIYPSTLAATLSGPTSITYQGNATYSINHTGGIPPFTYQWDYRIHCEEVQVASFDPISPPCDSWINGGSSDSFTLYANSDDDIDIRCTITDSLNQSLILLKTIDITGAPKVNISNSLPEEFVVEPNHPNPFNPVTTISFGIPETGKVMVNIYNSLGQLIKQLSNTILPAGNHKFDFNASQFSSGIYYYTIIYQNNVESRKMILMK